MFEGGLAVGVWLVPVSVHGAVGVFEVEWVAVGTCVPVGVGVGDPVGVRLFKDGMGVHEGDRVRVGVPLLETDSRLVTDSVRPMLWVWVPDSGLEV